MERRRTRGPCGRGVALVLLWAAGPLALDARAEPPPTREVLHDADCRVRLLRPGPRWVLLDEAAVSTYAPGAALGASLVPGAVVSLSVVPAPAGDLEAFLAAHLQRPATPDLRVDGQRRLRYAGFDAVRALASFTFGGVAMVEEDTVFLRGGLLHVIQGRAPASHVTASRGAWAFASAFLPGNAGKPPPQDAVEGFFRPFHEALDLLPGDLRPRPPVAARGAAGHGVGWRLFDGAFECAVSGLRVTPPPGWVVLPPEDLLGADPDARVGLAHAATGTLILLFDEPRLGRGADAYEAFVSAQVRAALGRGPLEARREATFLGAPLSLARHPLTHPYPQELAVATRATALRCHRIQVFSPSARLEASWAAAHDALTAVAEMSATEVAACAADLASRGDPLARVGPTVSVRGGRWREHALGLEWRAPAGAWRLLLPQQLPLGDALFVAEELGGGATLRWHRLGTTDLGFEAADDAQRHAFLAHQVLGPAASTAPVTTRTLGALTVRVSSVAVGAEAGAGVERTLRLLTGRWRGSTLAALASVPGPAGPAADAALDAITAGLRAEDGPTGLLRRGPAAVEDDRLGCALAVPGEGWAVREETPADLAPVGSVLHGMGPQQHVYLVALALPRAAEGPADLVLDHVRSELGWRLPGLGEPLREPSTLAGLPAERWTWVVERQRMDVLVASRGPLLYVLCATSREDGSGLSVDELRACFGLLP